MNSPDTPVMAVFGVGLIGGSMAIDVKAAGVVRHVIGVGRSQTNLDRALERGVIDEICHDVAEATAKADVLVLATPVKVINDLLPQVAPAMTADKVITDVGSVKAAIIAHARSCLGDFFPRFVPGHPVAGKEKSGINAAVPGLYQNHRAILTPVAETDREAVRIVERLWQTTGACVSYMDAAEHDRILSVTSHLPHMLAYTMMHLLATQRDPERYFAMAAGGFYDFTRTASSDAEMWRDIALLNRTEILAAIDQYQTRLAALAALVAAGDGAEMEQLFNESRRARARVKDH